jgi:hypothetical protein
MAVTCCGIMVWECESYTSGGPMKLTGYHANHSAHELTRVGGVAMGRLSPSLSGALVDLSPHQIDAAFFAPCYPVTKGTQRIKP